jgi:hypothetical protein
MDTGHTADSGNATLARWCGPIAAIRRANPFALIAIDEGGGDSARQHRDQGSPHPGSALLCRTAGTGSPVLESREQRSTARGSREQRSTAQGSIVPGSTTLGLLARAGRHPLYAARSMSVRSMSVRSMSVRSAGAHTA